jgi:mRNA interferase RelE/StbE
MATVGPYRVILADPARKGLNSLPRDVQARIIPRLVALADDPRPQGCTKLRGADQYRIRVGDYRVIYRIDDEAQIVGVEKITHRRDVYRP